MKEAYFLAPKSKGIIRDDGEEVVAHKGATKDHVSMRWYKDQYFNMGKKEIVKVSNAFSVSYSQEYPIKCWSMS